MKCPYCHNPETKVLDKRELDNEAITRRRRECLKCEKRFTTYERIDALNLTVIKKDGRKEPFDREKMKRGVLRALEKRPVTLEQVDDLVEKVELKLKQQKETEIQSKFIGQEVMRLLKKLDKVAYIRFASVYNEFKDLQDFKKEIKEVS